MAVGINLTLDSFDFRPGVRIFNFRLTGKPEFTFPECRNKVCVKFLTFIFEKIAGSNRIIEILSRTLNGREFLTWDRDLITLDLDKHPEADKLFEKRLPLIGTKIFDYVGIKEILFRKSEVVLNLKIFQDDPLKNYQEILDHAAAGKDRTVTAAASDSKQTFSHLLQKVKQSPDEIQTRVEQELTKLKKTAGKIGGKLWDRSHLSQTASPN